MSDNIAPEIVFSNILTRLPVKSLLRFRCVCKPWQTLIDSPGFVKSHLARNISTKSNTFIVTRDGMNNVNAYTLKCALVDKNTGVDFEMLGFVAGDVVGSVNGIVCLSLYTQIGSENAIIFTTSDGVNLVLWNPSTRKLFKLPFVDTDKSPTTVRTAYTVPSFGFGYDPVNDDYKVVRVDQGWDLYPFTNDCVINWDVKVFSLKSMSWTKGKGFPHALRCNRETARFANGALHWCLCPVTSAFQKLEDRDIIILAFDLCTEEYRLLPQPDYPNQISHNFLVAFEDTLGLVCDYNLGYTDIWIMKDYGVKDSWTRLISVSQCEFVRPVVYLKDGGQVLLEKDWEQIVSYDLKSKNVKESGIQGVPKFAMESMLYVESLVQLPRPREVSLKDEKKKKEKIRKKRDANLSKEFKLAI